MVFDPYFNKDREDEDDYEDLTDREKRILDFLLHHLQTQDVMVRCGKGCKKNMGWL